MRSNRELLIATRQFASERRLQSWWALASTLIAYFVSLAVCLSDMNLCIRGAASVLNGLLIIRMFIIYHDYQHDAILCKSRVAGRILDLYGLLVLSPPSVWKRSHDHHHKHNSKDNISVGSFPTMTCDQFTEASPAARWQYFLARHPLTILFGYLTVFMYGMCAFPAMCRPRLHLDAIAALILHVVLIGVLFTFGWAPLAFGMLLPLFTACGLGSYLFYAQHNFPQCRRERKDDWTHANAALLSSSYIRMNPIMSWFTGNIGLHHIHHLNARIPFYRLPEAMAHLNELQKPASSTLHPRDVLACFKANLWDETLQRFVSYHEARRGVA